MGRPFGTISSELDAAIQNIDSAKKAAEEAERTAATARNNLTEAQNKAAGLRSELNSAIDERMGTSSGGRVR